MAVEKLELLNLVAKNEDMDKFLRRLALMENVHLVNAMSEVNQSRFDVQADEKYRKEILEMCMIKQYRPDFAFKEMNDKLSFIMRVCETPQTIDKNVAKQNYLFDETITSVNDMYSIFKELHDKQIAISEEEAILDELEFVDYLGQTKIDLKQLKNMSCFVARVGSISKDNREKLALNYENITAAIMHIGEVKGEEVVLVVYPKDLAVENEKIMKSVFFRDIALLEEYLDYPDKMRVSIDERIVELKELKKEIDQSFEGYKKHYQMAIMDAYSKMVVEKTITYMKNTIAITRSFFYLAGWVPKGQKSLIEEALIGLDYQVIAQYKEVEQVASENKPPTKLKNAGFFRPFEMLVNLYGIPSYFEVDPTAIIGIIYMFLFGAMFGDLGQGLVIVAAGLYMARRPGTEQAGGFLARIGTSSMIFGLLYDSFFGFEGVLSGMVHNMTGMEVEHFFIRPLENMNLMLGASIVLGIFLLLFAFGMSIVNKIKHNELQEAYLGRNGITGLVLYVSGLLLIVSKVGLINGPDMLFTVLIIGALCVLLFREPIYNLIKGHTPLHHEPPVDYYVENSFELLDTLIAFTSNTLSFVRVGAFALNHVGLFIAFHTLATMIGGSTGSILMTIIGNLFVLTLEVLIVFIQGMRLCFYEMFSKYFVGGGVSFSSVEIKNYDVR